MNIIGNDKKIAFFETLNYSNRKTSSFHDMPFKILLFFSVLLINPLIVSSQEDNSSENDTSSVYSGFASIFFIPSSIGSETVVFLGGIGSVMIKDKIIVGGYGMRKTGMMYAEKGLLKGKMLSLGSAGLIGGYTFPAFRKVKPVIQCFVGWGGLTVSTADSKGYAITEEFNRLLVITPSLSVDINLHSFLWLSLGAEYMYVKGITLDGYTNSDFSRPGGYISLKVMTGE